MQDSKNKVNIVIPENYNGSPIECVIREGYAPSILEPKEPLKIDILGTLDAPLRWLEKRVETIDLEVSNIIVNRNEKYIRLNINETDYYKTVITGRLELSNKMLQFGINTGKKWEPLQLSQFFKMNRSFFTDKDGHLDLVSKLKQFKVSVNQTIEKSREENGSKIDHFSQVVESAIPRAFKVSLPLFKGFAPVDIEVELYADINGRDISFFLISDAAEEVIEDIYNNAIDEQLEAISHIAPEIVILEV